MIDNRLRVFMIHKNKNQKENKSRGADKYKIPENLSFKEILKEKINEVTENEIKQIREK